MALELVPGGNSLFAQSEHENVSPTCVEPKAGGNVSYLYQQSPVTVLISVLTFEPRIKSWSEDLDGNAKEAIRDILETSRGRGYC